LWIALPFGLLALFLLAFKRSGKWIGLTLILISGTLLFKFPEFKDRIFQKMGTTERFELWKANWNMFLDRPLTGVGFRKNHELSGPHLLEQYPEREHVLAVHAHILYIVLLGGLGIVGLLAWIFWIFSLIRILYYFL